MKITAHIQAQWDEYAKEYCYSVCHHEDMSEFGYVHIGSQDVEFDPPPADVLIAGTVAAYRKEQEKIRAEAHSKVKRLQDSIDALLCLEHKPEAA